MERIRKLLQSNQPAKWLFYGDSITHGALHTFGWRDYTETFTERIRFEMGRTRDVVIKTAISGNTTRDLLQDFEWRVRQFQPHAVFIMVGMNDCSSARNISPDEFRANLTQLCQRIAGLPSALPILQTTSLILPGTSPDREPNFHAYMEIIRQLARKEQWPLIDHAHCWEEAKAQQPGLLYYWMSDAFHPNQHGHQVFAELVFKELGIFDPKAFTCRLFHP